MDNSTLTFASAFLGGLLGLSIVVRMWLHSISTFVTLCTLFVVTAAIQYGYIDAGLLFLCISMFLLTIRGMFKPVGDKIVFFPKQGKQQQKRRKDDYKVSF